MKKIRFWFAGCLLAVPLVLAVWGFRRNTARHFPGSLRSSASCWHRMQKNPDLFWWGAALPPSGWTAPCWKSSCRSIKWSTSGCTPRWVPA